MKTRQNNTIKNSIKVASWEVKKLIWNKAFVVSLLLTPLIFGLFMWLPTFFERIAGEDEAIIGGEFIDTTAHIYIMDEVGIYGALSQKVAGMDNLVLKKHTGHEDDLRTRIKDNPYAGYVHITKEIFETRKINIITGDYDPHIPVAFDDKLIQALMHFELAKYNIEPEDVDRIVAGYDISVGPPMPEEVGEEFAQQDPLQPPPPPEPMPGEVTEFGPMDFIRRWAPAGLAMAIFAMILVSGITAMQSTISDKRDKMVEILLSSVSASSLMYGKIAGNFLAGLIQMVVYGIYVVIFLHFFVLPRFDDVYMQQLFSFIFVPELPLFLLFALSGYLLFSSLYASLGATMEDIHSAGNFQGIVMFLPAIPFIFMSHVIADPGGIIAQVGSYIPFTSAIVMILRMTLLDLSWVEIALPLIVLLVSTALIAKLSGKIFKTGMLMYGQGAGLKEMWRWVRE